MKRYVDDYEIVVIEDEKGGEKKSAVYRGSFFEINLTGQDLGKFKRNSMLWFVAVFVLHMGAGFLVNRGMYQLYVALPYVLVFLPEYYLAAGIFRLPKDRRKFRRDEIELSFTRIKKASTFLLVLISVLGLAELIFIVGWAVEMSAQEVFFLLLITLAGVGAYILFRLQKTVQITANDSHL